MIILDNLGKHHMGRLWINHFPEIHSTTIDTLTAKIPANPNIQVAPCSVTVEFLAPRDCSYYALLGATYTSKEGKTLEIGVNIHDKNDEIYKDAIAYVADEVHPGIPEEYAKAIMSAAEKTIIETGGFPSGKLEFVCGAHGDVGSSRFIFSKVTSMIIHLISQNPDHLSKEAMETLLLKSFRSQMNYLEGL